MSLTTCSDYLADTLVAAGVPYVAGIPGHGNLVFEDAILRRADRIRWILVRHEQSAAHLADAYFRASGKPLAVTTSVGPGALNTLIGVATAYVDSSAMLLVTGAPPAHLFGKGCLQEIERQNSADFPSIIRPLVKRSFHVERGDQLATVVPQLLKLATTGRPGPVHLDFPMDVQAESIDVPPPDPSLYEVAPRVRPDAVAVERAAELLVSARCPALLVGGGVINAGASAEVLALAEHLGAVVVTSLHGKGAISDDHPLAARACGSKGTTCANEVMRHADVILAIGTRFGEWDTSSWHPGDPFSFPPATLIHLDIDDRELGKVYPTRVALWGDAKAGLADIQRAVEDRTPRREWRTSEWVEQLDTWRRDWFSTLDARAAETAPMSTTRALRELRAALPRETIVLGAAGHAQGQMFSEWEVYQPRTHLSSSHFSTMGFALPGAIGAKLARPDRPVVAIMGDGDVQMSIQEMATAIQYRVPIVAVVLNNGGLLSVRDLQVSALGSRRFDGTEFKIAGTEEPSNPDFVALAKAYGFMAERVAEPEEVAPALDRLLESGRPALLEVCTASTFPASDGLRISYFDMPVPEVEAAPAGS